VVEPESDLLVVTQKGFGKRTPLKQYSPKGRGTLGIKTIDTNALGAVGKIAAARVVSKEDDLTLISVGGQVLRTKVKDIKQASRPTRGVIIFKMDKGDFVATIAIIRPSDLKKVDPGVDSGDPSDEEDEALVD
jgi:DNA gyrase subunit A